MTRVVPVDFIFPPRCLSIKSSLLASLLRFAPNLLIRDCDEVGGRNGLAAMIYCGGVKDEEVEALTEDGGGLGTI